MKRPSLPRDVVAFIEENVPVGLSGHVASLIRPCVMGRTMKVADSAIAIGATKFGGRPDVPAGFEWPTVRGVPCWFVAQVRVADVRPFDIDCPLPRTGLLSFFYHDDQGAAGRSPRVFAFGRQRLRRVDIVPDDRYGGQEFHDRHLYPRRLELSQGFSLPAEPAQYGLTRRQKVQWPWEELLDFKERFHARFARGSHQLFGQPAHLKLPRTVRLIASFGEVSTGYLFIARPLSDGAPDWDRVRVIYQCS